MNESDLIAPAAGRPVAGGEARDAAGSGGSRSTRRVVAAALVGTLVEYYEFAVYSYLATVIAIVFFSREDPTTALLSTLATLAVAFVVRPVGAVIFGHIGDRIGRKQALSLTIIIMTVATLLIGVLPGYATIGVVATIALVLLRAIQGLSTGGELAAAVSFVAEHASARRRGLMIGLVQLGMMLGTLLGAGVAALLSVVFSQAQIEEWAWRLPFVLAVPIGAIGLYIRHKLEDAAVFQEIKEAADGERPASPVKALFTTQLGAWVRAVCLSVASVAGYWVVFVYMPIYMESHLHFERSLATASTTVSIAVAAVSLVVFALLGDRLGRKRVYAVVCAGLLVLALPMLLVISTGQPLAVFLAHAALGVFAGASTSVLNAILAELFHTSLRSTGVGLGFNMANILAGGTAPFVVAQFVQLFPDANVPAFYIMAFCVVALIAIPGIKRNEGRTLVDLDTGILEQHSAKRSARATKS